MWEAVKRCHAISIHKQKPLKYVAKRSQYVIRLNLAQSSFRNSNWRCTSMDMDAQTMKDRIWN
eukprot:5400901-Amphidinium_carterae.1